MRKKTTVFWSPDKPTQYPWLEDVEVQPLWARVNLRTMAMKEYSTFPKPPALLESHYQIV